MAPTATFAELGLPAPMVKALDRSLISTPFAIQAATIPDTLSGRDVLARAPTGSGKTLAFGLPLLAQLSKAKPGRPTGLILSPTRELAEQIRRELSTPAQAMGLTILAVYGGTGFGNQLKQLSHGVDLLVACPGRLIDLINQRVVTLDRIERVVVDEADRMADMGFLPVIRQILDQTTARQQMVLFSATLDDDVQVLTDQYLNQPVRHEVGEVEPDLSLVDHRFIEVESAQRVVATAKLIGQYGSSMVFVRTRHGADRLAQRLKKLGVKAGQIHGGRSQGQRDNALKSFTQGKTNVLVATDVAARGIHVDGVACVVHYDPPADHKDYVHRSGRTARAGAGGAVLTLVLPGQKAKVGGLRRRLNIDDGGYETLDLSQPLELGTQPATRTNTAKAHKPTTQSKPGAKSKPGVKSGTKAQPSAKGSRGKSKRSGRRRSKNKKAIQGGRAGSARQS